MNLLTSIFKSLSRVPSVTPLKPTQSKELRFHTKGYTSNEIMKIGACIQKILSEHEGVSSLEWIGIHTLDNREFCVWLYEVDMHLHYNVLLELQSRLENFDTNCSSLDRTKIWDLKLMFQ